MKQQVIEKILEYKAIAIVRGVYGEDCLNLAKALCAGGIKLLEATFDQKSQEERIKTVETIKLLCKELGDQMLFGAGTVTTPEMVKMAKDAGATFIISPDTCEEVIRATVDMGLVSIPGAYTATEAKQAYLAGADFVKLFPCVGDAPAYVKAICAPFNHIPFLAVGGVSADNAAEFLKAGAVGLGVGSCLANKKWADAGRYDLITEEAKKFVANIR